MLGHHAPLFNRRGVVLCLDYLNLSARFAVQLASVEFHYLPVVGKNSTVRGVKNTFAKVV
jgi:hypothetical protein